MPVEPIRQVVQDPSGPAAAGLLREHRDRLGAGQAEDNPYILVEAGPEQAHNWRTGHMRNGLGSLPDLFFPADRSWLVSALWDDTWTCVGGPNR